MDKQTIRDSAIRRRQGMQPFVVQERSESIAQQFMKLALPDENTMAAVYLALPGEADPFLISEHLRKLGFSLAVPALEPDEQAYQMVVLEPGAMMVKGRYGVFEPRDAVSVDPAVISLILVPGLAFDPAGHRLGYGKGYYDKLLSSGFSPTALKVGLAFDDQIVEAIPAEDHDVRMDVIVTERRVIRCQS